MLAVEWQPGWPVRVSPYRQRGTIRQLHCHPATGFGTSV